MADFLSIYDVLPQEYVPLASTFLLVFAIIFGLLEITKVFGDKGTNINILISVVIAIFAASDQTILKYTQIGLPYVLGIMALLFIYVMWLKIQEQKNKSHGGKDNKRTNYYFILIVCAMLLITLGSAWGGISQYLPRELQTRDTLWGISLAIFVVMLWAAAEQWDVSQHPELHGMAPKKEE